jgi:hypothetical protein
MRLWCSLVVGWTIESLSVLPDDTWWWIWACGRRCLPFQEGLNLQKGSLDVLICLPWHHEIGLIHAEKDQALNTRHTALVHDVPHHGQCSFKV